MDRLTRRKQEIAELVAQGMTNAQIAERIGTSEQNVANHIQRMYEEFYAFDDPSQTKRVRLAVDYVRHQFATAVATQLLREDYGS